jgi:transcription initiation factor TFIIB
MTSITENSVKIEMCPECYGRIILIKEKGETVCSQCGLIIYERQFDISHKGIRIFNKDDSKKKERYLLWISEQKP